jgi:hypothetical protein
LLRHWAFSAQSQSAARFQPQLGTAIIIIITTIITTVTTPTITVITTPITPTTIIVTTIITGTTGISAQFFQQAASL